MKSAIARGFVLGFLPFMERIKIIEEECETKREIKDFHLRGSVRNETTWFWVF